MNTSKSTPLRSKVTTVEPTLHHENINYPFGQNAGRDNARLFFDFSVGLGAFDHDIANKKVLDFACGSGWTTEWLNRIGYDVFGFDIDPGAIEKANLRPELDKRIDINRYHTTLADGHTIPYKDATFAHVFCFDSLHHIKDYEKALGDIRRVLVPGGRAIFVEPGSRHSKSPQTVQFLKDHNLGDWWIEKDVDLMEIWELAQKVGFKQMKIKPYLLPSMVDYNFWEWFHILENPEGIKNYMSVLRRYAYEDRVCFYLA